MFLAVLFFDKTTVVLAMLFCCVGDSVAGLVGAIFYPLLGKDRTAIPDYSGQRQPLRLAVLAHDLAHALRHKNRTS